MNIFYRPSYNSDATNFLNQLRAAKPELVQQQQVGRNLLWDKTVDRGAHAEFRAARVAQKPYVYQSHGE